MQGVQVQPSQMGQPQPHCLQHAIFTGERTAYLRHSKEKINVFILSSYRSGPNCLGGKKINQMRMSQAG